MIARMVDADTTHPRLQAAWRLTIGVVNEALSYDLCILPPAIVGPLARSLDELVLALISRILGHPLTDAANMLLRLERQRGGCGVASSATRSWTAFLSSVLANPPMPPTIDSAWSNAGLTPHVRSCIAWLAERGIALDEWGIPRSNANTRPLSAESLPTCPIPRRQQLWKPHLQERLLRQLADMGKVPHLGSRGGRAAGTFINASPAEAGFLLTDLEWVGAMRVRLGMPVCSSGPCTHMRGYKSGGRACGHALDTSGTHAMGCNIGAGVTAIHDGIRDVMGKAGQAAGFRTLVEQVIPELADNKRKEPRVDVEAFGHAHQPDVLLDVTVADPWAIRYNQADTTKLPAASAERRKDTEYPSRGGYVVRGIAVDLLGNFGPHLDEVLSEWAALARARDFAFGYSSRRWLQLWQIQISAIIAKGVARQIATAQRWHRTVAARASRPLQCAGCNAPCLPDREHQG